MNETYTTTKSVAQMLGISEPSVRLYAKKMENLGHTFSRWQNARQFSKADVDLIREAMIMHSESPHDVETCFRYVITKMNEGETEADKILHETKPIVQQTDILTKENEVYKDLKGDNENILGLLQEIKEYTTPVDDMVDAEELRVLEQEVKDLKEELEAVRSMNIFEFRKWKKNLK